MGVTVMTGNHREMPDPRQARRFVFSDCSYDRASGTASLAYRFDDGPKMVEKIIFPDAPWPESAERQQAFLAALEILHLVAAVSYYKAGLCTELEFKEPSAAAAAGDFLQTLYVEGLAEFAWVNGLDVASRIRFPSAGQSVQPFKQGFDGWTIRWTCPHVGKTDLSSHVNDKR